MFSSWAIPRHFFIVSFVLLLGGVSPIGFTEATASSLKLTWTDNAANEDGFKVQRLNGSTYIDIASVGANVQSYTDSGLISGKTYCYRVRAFNSAGISDPSNQTCGDAPQSGTGEVPPIDDGGGGSGGGGSEGGSGGGTPTATPPGKWSDYRISLDMQSLQNGAIGIMFRYQDDKNYYRFSWDKQRKYRRLEKLRNGNLEVLAQDSERYNTGQSYHLVIAAQGDTLTVWIDGVQIFRVNDGSFTTGTVALYSFYNRGSVFDNVLVEDLINGAVLLSDDFSNADFQGWTVLDQGDRFAPSAWSVQNGALVQSDNIGSNTKQAYGTFALFTEGSWTDYRIAVKLKSNDNDTIGIMFRYQNNDNYYRFAWDHERQFRRLEKRVNGAFTTLAQDAVPYVIGRTYQVEIAAKGSNLQVMIDGNPIFAINDSTFAGGTIALFSRWNEGSHFDDVLVEDANSGNTLLWDDFNDGNFTGWSIIDDAGTSYGPSGWSAQSGALVQSSNIGSDVDALGTFALYSN